MTHRQLDELMRAFRIGDPAGQFAIFSGEGSARAKGRWHKKGQEVIYCSQNYGTALLEKLARYSGIVPSNQHFIEVLIPAKTSYEVVTKDSLPRWDSASGKEARAYGSSWISEVRSAILIVPSLPSLEENNILINPNHSEFPLIKPGRETPIRWDVRLIKKP